MSVLDAFLDKGFVFQAFPIYPRNLGVAKEQFAALLDMSEDGKLKLFSSAGYLLDTGEIALLIERQGKPVFVYKTREVPADEAMLVAYRNFLDDLHAILKQQ